MPLLDVPLVAPACHARVGPPVALGRPHSVTPRCLTGCIWTARAGSTSVPVAEVLNDSYLSVLVKNRIDSVGFERCATLGHRGPGPASPVSLLLPPPGVSCVSPLLRPQPPPLLLPQSLSREWVSRRAQVTFVPDAHRRGAPGDGPEARLRPPTSRVTVALASHTSSPPLAPITSAYPPLSVFTISPPAHPVTFCW